jgi:hypothetical protein
MSNLAVSDIRSRSNGPWIYSQENQMKEGKLWGGRISEVSVSPAWAQAA